MKKFNLQHFAEQNVTKKADLEPAISIDHNNRLVTSIRNFLEIIGINSMTPMPAGTDIKIYALTKTNSPAQVGEGDQINITKVERKLKKTITLGLNKYRKVTSIEAIQKVGRERAINDTDKKLVSEIQKDIKAHFFSNLAGTTGASTVTGANLQTTLANAWAKVNALFEDEDVNAIYFVNGEDVAEYLGSANVTMQTAFGFTYLQNFLGLGTAIVSPRVTKGTIIATAKENLNGAYIPSNGDVAELFGLTADATGYVGMTHSVATNTATIETLLVSGVEFYPERADGVVIGTITVPEEQGENPSPVEA